MSTKNLIPNYKKDQLVNSTDLIRYAHLVDWQDSYMELSKISVALNVAAHQDPALRMAMESLSEKILAAARKAEDQAEQPTALDLAA